MCGRYTLALPAVQVKNRFNVSFDSSLFKPHFNAAPGQTLPLITDEQPNVLSYHTWGLLPFWAKDPGMAYKMINARAETLLEKAAFRHPVKHQRCLVIADGFYEWEKLDKRTKQPYRIGLTGFVPYAMAGIWSEWKDAEQRSIRTFSIITVAANKLVAPVHDRMPAILPGEHERDWLSQDAAIEEILPLLKPYPSRLMEKYKVSTLVNKATQDDPAMIARMDTGEQGALF